MKEKAEDTLWRWGEAERTANYINLNNSNNPLFMAMQYGTRISSPGLVTHEDKMVDEMDNLVRKLLKRRPKAGKALRIRYMHDHWTDEDCARKFGSSRSTFQKWLKEGREYIEKNFPDQWPGNKLGGI